MSNLPPEGSAETPRPDHTPDAEAAASFEEAAASAGGAGSAQDPTPGENADAEAAASSETDISVEDLVVNLEQVTTERDEYLDALRRLQAEFENYRKAVAKREADAKARANDGLVSELLPVLDACDGAVANGSEEVAPIRLALLDSLEKQGLERLEPAGAPFDPEQHEAVMHEDGDEADGPVVSEVLRVGYGWKGRVVRPVMVKTRG